MLNSGKYRYKIDIYEKQEILAYLVCSVSDEDITGYVKTVVDSESDYVPENTVIYADRKLTVQKDVSNGSNYEYVDKLPVENQLGEFDTDYILVKSGLFAEKVSRIGGLLNGRPADTVLTSCTHKFTWRMKSFSNVQPDKHRIKYGNKIFEVNYCLGDERIDDELQVFATERV